VTEALSSTMAANQLLVEMRMQGLDFKAEVDRRCNQVLGNSYTYIYGIELFISRNVAFVFLSDSCKYVYTYVSICILLFMDIKSELD
jgi:hypothetical protein